ncbi:uncharacterized protein LOC129946577 [Eupeodes corollae]|uniref:uncharacterized protein LOC129946577 n=1 Tax=Eupeodes corollae TaxID=290404 RepID=UPI0024930135|nr:uncharacterized protein LOC129946577 [Eupeodes corollae]XP_055912793.1 uncharacterized protein LOC129946577 [Eupeodes corollae]
MAILHSCCFWKTVRKGSYASAIYTLIYFGGSSFMLLQYIQEEQEYLTGKIKKPIGESILEQGDVSPTSVIFNIVFLVCSLCLVCSSILVILGIWKDRPQLLLPWTFFMFADIFIEFFHLVYLVKLKRLMFVPLVSVVLTLDFFILCLNVYCLLCVISQYQEFKSGRLNSDVICCIRPSEIGSVSNSSRNVIQQFQLAVSPYPYQQTNFSVIPEESESNPSLREGGF